MRTMKTRNCGQRCFECYMLFCWRATMTSKFTRSMASTGPLNFQILPLSQHLKPSTLKSSVYTDKEVKLAKSCMQIFTFGVNEPSMASIAVYKMKIAYLQFHSLKKYVPFWLQGRHLEIIFLRYNFVTFSYLSATTNNSQCHFTVRLFAWLRWIQHLTSLCI